MPLVLLATLKRLRARCCQLPLGQQIIRPFNEGKRDVVAGIFRPAGTSFEDIAVSYCNSNPPVPIDVDSSELTEGAVGKRRVEDSWLELILPFPDHATLRETMVDVDGKTIRFGKMFEILDALAADVAYRHVCSPGLGFKEEADRVTIVTACVDGMRNFDTISVDEELRLQGYLSYVGTSSMEVCIDIIRIASDAAAAEQLCGTVQFIMAARDNTRAGGGKGRAVHGLLLPLDSAATKLPVPAIYAERFARGKQRAGVRKSKLASSLSVAPPKPEEVEIIHKLYLTSRELKSQKNLYLMGLNTIDSAGADGPSSGTGGTARVKSLLRNLQNGKIKWMKHTVFRNIVLMQPQARNVHGKIFGGYIMRVAYEMAQVTAIVFFGESLVPTYPKSGRADVIPAFVAGDDVKFVRPIEIGDAMEFSSTVIYSLGDHAVVQVIANEVDKYTSKRTLTNMFTYVFSSGSSAESRPDNSVQVMPREYDEFVLYLEGKRSLDLALAAEPSSDICTVNREL